MKQMTFIKALADVGLLKPEDNRIMEFKALTTEDKNELKELLRKAGYEIVTADSV